MNHDSMRNASLADKINLPEKTPSLLSHWEITIVLLSDKSSTRGKNGEWVWERIQPKRPNTYVGAMKGKIVIYS